MSFSWGVLGPDVLESQRRTRGLGLNAAVRSYNELAVPGMGNVWFGKQLFLALLGISVAEKFRKQGRRASNIETANAIEALACTYALRTGQVEDESRVRGKRKLPRDTVPAFSQARKPGFYVTIPMRMETVQALLALQFVEKTSERFNAYSVAEAGQGRAFLREACLAYPKVETTLLQWMSGNPLPKKSAAFESLLMPHIPLAPKALEVLYEGLVSDKDSNHSTRRHDALQWVATLGKRGHTDWEKQPRALGEAHWNDLRAGAYFFRLRDAALFLLDAIEAGMQPTDTLMLEDAARRGDVPAKIAALREYAEGFLAFEAARPHADAFSPVRPYADAVAFATECSEKNAPVLLKNLLERDERCLCHRDGRVIPGPAFRGESIAKAHTDSSEENTAPSEQQEPPLPEGISHRIRNMYWLSREIFNQTAEARK